MRPYSINYTHPHPNLNGILNIEIKPRTCTNTHPPTKKKKPPLIGSHFTTKSQVVLTKSSYSTPTINTQRHLPNLGHPKPFIHHVMYASSTSHRHHLNGSFVPSVVATILSTSSSPTLNDARQLNQHLDITILKKKELKRRIRERALSPSLMQHPDTITTHHNKTQPMSP